MSKEVVAPIQLNLESAEPLDVGCRRIAARPEGEQIVLLSREFGIGASRRVALDCVNAYLGPW